MNSSSNDGAFADRALNRRLGAALVASFAAHAALVGLFPAQPGAACCELSFAPATAPLKTRLAALERVTEAPPPEPRPAPEPQSPEAVAHSAGPTPAAPLPVQRYYLTRELDGIPAPYSHIEPDYPESARIRGLAGRVRILLYLDESGRVERVWIMEAEPAGVFEESVARAFGTARFTPGIKDGQPVKSQMALEVRFDPPPLPGLSGR